MTKGEAFTLAFTERAVENALERAAQLATIRHFTKESFLAIAATIHDEETARMRTRFQAIMDAAGGTDEIKVAT